MPKITYIEHSRRVHIVDVPIKHSVMEGSRSVGVEGILGECGGACSCATCHVYVDPAWVNRLPAMQDMERDMLDFATSVDPERSRLSCQIRVTEEMDGLLVYVPADQF